MENTNTSSLLQSELKLGTNDLVEGRGQQALDRLVKMTEQQLSPPAQAELWGAIILALISNRMYQPAEEALGNYPDTSSVHLNRATWLLSSITGWNSGKELLLSDLEPTSFDEYLSTVCNCLFGCEMENESRAAVNNALMLHEMVAGSFLPPKLERHGTEYGGWVITADSLDENSICYCAGVGEDISFDLGVLNRYGCTVHGFDPTPRSKAFIEQTVSGESRYVFHPIGLWDKEETLTFYAPENPDHVSHSVHDLQQTSNAGFDADVKKLKDIMESLGHGHIDCLKMDIEGAEYPVVETIVEDKLDIRTLCIEYHHYHEKPDSRYLSIRSLQNAGYRLVNIEHDNYTFVHGR